MKKFFGISVLASIVAVLVFAYSADAQSGKHGNHGKHNCSKFVDANNDGKCDNFTDANNDGKCDNCTGTGSCTGTCDGKGKGMGKCDGTGMGKCDGIGMGQGMHKCGKFADANNDGKCDSFIDANNDGKCDNCNNASCSGTCDGTAKGMHSKSGKGMKHGQGKGSCGSSCTSKNNVDLNQNTPNPVSGTTKITFNLKESGLVKVILSDKLGNKVKDVFEGNLNSGDNEVELNVTGLNPGNYFYSVSVGGKSQTKQLIVVK